MTFYHLDVGGAGVEWCSVALVALPSYIPLQLIVLITSPKAPLCLPSPSANVIEVVAKNMTQKFEQNGEKVKKNLS